MATKYLDKVGLAYFWSKIKAWCNSLFALDSDVIHKDSNEVIDGVKEFSNSYYDSTREGETDWESSSLIIRYKNYIKGSGTPSVNKYANLLFLDKIGTNINWNGRLGAVENDIIDNGMHRTRLVCYKNEIENGVDTHEAITLDVGYDINNVKFATAPSTSEDRTSNIDILTRDWIPKDTRIVHTIGDETIAGIKTFSSTITGSISGNAETATKLATARNINGVAFDGSANITVADSTKLPLSGGTMTGDITMSASKSIIFDLSATTPTANTARSFPIQFKSKSITGDYVFTNYPFFEIPLTQDANYGMGVGFGAGGLTIIGAGEAGRNIVAAESLTGYNEQVVIVADSTIDFYTNCNYIANRVKTSIDTSGNFTGKASNVTGTVDIANGGTGATTRLNAVKALTNESVGTAATFFLTITNSWGKAGYTSVTDVKTVLGLRSAAYTESSDYATASHTHSYLPLSGGTITNTLSIQKNVVKGTAPSSTAWYSLAMQDSNNTNIALIESSYNTNKSSFTGLYAYNTTVSGSTGNIGYLGIGCDTAGNWYTHAPTPATNSNNDNIATTAFVKAQGYTTATGHTHDYLSLSGGTLTGNLSFNGNNYRVINKLTSITRNVAPSSVSYNWLVQAVDSAASSIGGLYYTYATDKTTSLQLLCYSGITTDNTYEEIRLGFKPDGSAYTKAPTPPTSDNSTQIATTAFVKSQGYLTSHQSLDSCVKTTGNQTIDGYKVFSKKISVNGIGGLSGDAGFMIYANESYTNYGGSKIILDGSSGGNPGRIAFHSYGGTSANSAYAYLKGEFGFEVEKNISCKYAWIETLNPYLYFIETDTTKGSSNGSYQGMYFCDSTQTKGTSIQGESVLGAIIVNCSSSTYNYMAFVIAQPVANSTKTRGIKFAYEGGTADSNLCFYPSDTDNAIKFGSSAHRWNTIFAGTSTISTSDARLKSEITVIPDNILDAWEDLNWYLFKMNDSITEKGDKARIHSGTIAQEVARIFIEHGLDPNRYGMYCYDEWNAKEEVRDKDGNIKEEAEEAGDRYSLRYEEVFCIEAAYQRRKNKILENRISELENQLSSVLQTLKELKGVG